MHNVIIRTLTLASLAGAALFGTPAQARWNGSGSQMKAALAGDAACLQANVSYGGIINNCPYSVWAKGTLQVQPQGYFYTQVSIYGNNSFCEVASTDSTGNAAYLGSRAWTVAGPQHWQTLNTGNTPVWDSTPVVYSCYLEPGGMVGSFTAYY